MPSKVNKFKLGLIVTIGLTLGLIALIWIGASQFLHKKATYVSYFQESVKGLQKGATVNYRGVGVGRVADIRLAPDGRLIEVVMHLDPSFSVDETLCVRIREQGLTGLRFLEIDTKPPGMAKYTPKIRFKPPYPVIPAYPSEIEQLKTAMETIYQKILSIDVKGISDKLNKLMAEGLELLRDKNWKPIISQLRESTESIKSITTKIDRGTKEEDIHKLVENAVEILHSLNEITETLAKEMKSKSFQAFLRDLREGVASANETFKNLASGSEALNKEKIGELSKNLTQILQKTNTTLGELGTNMDNLSTNLEHGLEQFIRLLDELRVLVQLLESEPNMAVFGKPTKEPFK